MKANGEVKEMPLKRWKNPLGTLSLTTCFFFLNATSSTSQNNELYKKAQPYFKT